MSGRTTVAAKIRTIPTITIPLERRMCPAVPMTNPSTIMAMKTATLGSPSGTQSGGQATGADSLGSSGL